MCATARPSSPIGVVYRAATKRQGDGIVHDPILKRARLVSSLTTPSSASREESPPHSTSPLPTAALKPCDPCLITPPAPGSIRMLNMKRGARIQLCPPITELSTPKAFPHESPPMPDVPTTPPSLLLPSLSWDPATPSTVAPSTPMDPVEANPWPHADIPPPDSMWRFVPPRQRAPLQELALEQDVLKHMQQREGALWSEVDPKYFRHQSDLSPKVRVILLDWMQEVCHEFALRRETYYLAMSHVDRFLSKIPHLPRGKLQLVGAAALYLASKFEEIYAPSAQDFMRTTDNAYTKKELCVMEKHMLEALKWELLFPTSYSFVIHYLHQLCRHLIMRGDVHLEDTDSEATASDPLTHFSNDYMSVVRVFPMDLFCRMMDVLDAATMDARCMRYTPSRLAVAVLSLVYTNISMLEEITELSMDEVREEVEWVKRFVDLEVQDTSEQQECSVRDPFLVQTYHPAAMQFVCTQ